MFKERTKGRGMERSRWLGKNKGEKAQGQGDKRVRQHTGRLLVRYICLAMPRAASAQPVLASHSTQFLIIFLCICAYGGAKCQQLEQDHGPQGHVSGCQHLEWTGGLMCDHQPTSHWTGW